MACLKILVFSFFVMMMAGSSVAKIAGIAMMLLGIWFLLVIFRAMSIAVVMYPAR